MGIKTEFEIGGKVGVMVGVKVGVKVGGSGGSGRSNSLQQMKESAATTSMELGSVTSSFAI